MMTTAYEFDKFIPTLYEDDHLVAIEKPAGIDVSAHAGPNVNLSAVVSDKKGDGRRLEAANLLSRYESGVVLFAKDPTFVRHIRTGLKTGRVALEYVAVVLGHMPQATLAVNPVHGTSRGKRPPAKGAKKRVRPTDHPAHVAEAARQTVVHALRAGQKRSLVRCKTAVENTHALRAQLRAVRLRLLGDRLHDAAPGQHDPASTCLHLAKVSFYHPGRKTRITITSKEPRSFAALVDGGYDIERPALAALVRRIPCLADESTDAYRLLTGSAEDVPGLVAERFGDLVILQILEDRPKVERALKPLARWYQRVLGVSAVYAKRLIKKESHDEPQPGDMCPPGPLVGKPVAPEYAIRELGLRYLVRPHGGASVGLFLDQRDNRGRVREMAAGKEMLNLFSYTCGFSVAAAAGGATRTVSVDLSSGHLDWGRANFRANGLDPEDHEFYQADADEYLKRARRQGRQFDLVVLDPPSFAHGRKRGHSFAIIKDLPALVSGAAAVLRPEGVMLVSTNYRRLSIRALRDLVHQGAGNRRLTVIATPGLAPDFAMDPHHAKSIFVQFA